LIASGTLSFAGGAILAQVTVDDPLARGWTVRWGGYAEESGETQLWGLPGTTLIDATQVLGDFDDGTHRTIQLRPAGQDNWCDLNMHMSGLY